MLSIWINSPCLLAKALGNLVSSLGYQVQFEEEPTAALALWDLSCCERPYPPAPSIPTLALLRGDEDELELQGLSQLGYKSYLQSGEGLEALKRVLEALSRAG